LIFTRLSIGIFYVKQVSCGRVQRQARPLPGDAVTDLLVPQHQHDSHNQESYAGEKIGADGYETGCNSPELQPNE
jgi:hypothetical protein